MRVLLIGNCQAEHVARCMSSLAPELRVSGIFLDEIRKNKLNPSDIDWSSDLILYQPIANSLIEDFKHKIHGRLGRFPRIIFNGFHPDMAHVYNGRGLLHGATGSLNSLLVLYGYLRDFTADEIVSLFNERVFEKLGYFKQFNVAKKQLLEEARQSDAPIDHLVERWVSDGSFMYTYNHPRISVLCDVARIVLLRENIELSFNNVEPFVEDELRKLAVWGVYPEIARRIGFLGDYAFKRSERFGETILSLEEFVEHSLQSYARYDRSDLRPWPALDDFLDRYDAAVEAGLNGSPTKQADHKTPRAKGRHPYAGLPDYQFWRKAVAKVEMAEVDPVVRAPFPIDKTMRIATAGSCFAQHIANALAQRGFNHFIAERPAPSMTASDAHRKNYGVFSARYGNLYTARQLNQLFDRAYGNFVPLDSVWQRSDGVFVDPFRPEIEPDGFASSDALEKNRETHFRCVRTMLETLDVFVFTLGLTEAWRSLDDGAVFPVPPGASGGEMDVSRYGFMNFDVDETYEDLSSFAAKLYSVNPKAKVILTVSPVPLIATYEDRHVLSATTYSKSVLRVAAERCSSAFENIYYFPSYEIITGNYNKGRYFEEDFRNVTADGVNHVMRLFFKHFTVPHGDGNEQGDLDPLFDVVCEEELLDHP